MGRSSAQLSKHNPDSLQIEDEGELIAEYLVETQKDCRSTADKHCAHGVEGYSLITTLLQHET